MRKPIFRLGLIVCCLLLSGCVTPPQPVQPGGRERPPTATPAPEPTAVSTPTPGAGDPAARETPTPAPGGDGNGVAVLLPDAVQPRWEGADRQSFERVLQAAGAPYSIANAGGEGRVQVQQAQQALADGAKVLVLASVDDAAGAEVIALARAAGVPVVEYSRLTRQGPGADLFVAFDDTAVGQLMGETLEPLIDGLDADPKRVVLLNGPADDDAAHRMHDGYAAVASPYFDAGDWELAGDEALSGWDRQQAQTAFAAILAASGPVDAAFAASDDLAGGVIAALQREGLGPIPLSGEGATLAGVQNLLTGWQTLSVYKPDGLEAETAALTALALLLGDEVSSLADLSINNGTNDIPFVAILPLAVLADNVAETVVADGRWSWEEICTGEVAQFCPADR